MATATAYKMAYASWVSTRYEYTNFGSCDWRRRNWNDGLVCTPSTSIETADFTTVVIGTGPPTDVPIGFEASASLTKFAQAALRPGSVRTRQRPSQAELGYHPLVLEYEDEADVDARSGDHLLLLRADVVDELSIEDLEDAAGFTLNTAYLNWDDPITGLPEPGLIYGLGRPAP